MEMRTLGDVLGGALGDAVGSGEPSPENTGASVRRQSLEGQVIFRFICFVAFVLSPVLFLLSVA